jgi:hypothetical protein
MSAYIEEMNARVREKYLREPWGRVAQAAGYDPVDVESRARGAFAHCADRIENLEGVLADIMQYDLRAILPADLIARIEALRVVP